MSTTPKEPESSAHVQSVEMDTDRNRHGGFPHYMLKEIYEQPETIENAMRGRLSDPDASAHFGGLNLDPKQLRRIDRIILTACGTSYHAGIVGEYLFEEFARIPVEVEYASEFRYRNPPVDQQHHRHRHHAVGRDGGYAGRTARIEAQGPPNAGDLQRRRQHHRPRGRWRRLSACRPRNRRRQHQGVHVAGDGAGDAGSVLRPHAASIEHSRREDDRGTARHARLIRKTLRCHDASSASPRSITASTTCCTWAGSISIRWRSKAL